MKNYLSLTAILVLFVLLNSCHKTQEGSIIPPSLHTQISILAGSGNPGESDGSATAASFTNPYAIAVDGSGNVYVTDNGSVRIRKISSDGTVTTLEDNPNSSGSIVYAYADGLVIDAAGNFYVSYANNNCIRKITPDGKTGVLFAGNPSADGGFSDGTGTAALFLSPTGLAIDASGNIYIADTGNSAIRKITPAGVVTTIAGTGTTGSKDGAAAQASFYNPYGVALDKNGNVFVADGYNYKIRKITPGGTVSTVAGNGIQGNANGPAATASFYLPKGVTVANDGTIYVTDYADGLVRRITPAGAVSYVGFDILYNGFYEPSDLILDKSGTLYVVNAGLDQIVKIIPQQVL